MSKKMNKKGFTLIEVVLVLAIGGLIFLLAFLAFQQVSRNRRDSSRRSDASRIVAEIQNWRGDRGAFPVASVALTSNVCTGGATPAPTSFQAFLRSHMCRDNDFRSPQNSYTTRGFFDSGTAAVDSIIFAPGVDCTMNPNPDSVMVQIQLESGTVCRDSR